MKGACSGVQKLIRKECPDVLYVGCICHLADITVKAGMQALPVDINQLFVMCSTTFFIAARGNKNFVIFGLPCSLPSLRRF